MEIQLQELIDQIKKDGVDAAEAEARAIVEEAERKAKAIIADAEQKAEKLIADAKAENKRNVKASEDSIRQAGRNLLISFRESVSRELKAIVGENVSSVYSSEALAGVIVNAVEAWAKNSSSDDITVFMNTADLKKLEDNIWSMLKERMNSGVTLKANDNFDGGFRIAVNDGGAYYDYSSEAVVDMLSNYLSPKVTELLKAAE